MKVIAKSCTQNLIQNARVLVINIKKKKKKNCKGVRLKATTTLRRCELSIDKTENESAPLGLHSFLLSLQNLLPFSNSHFQNLHTEKLSLSLSLSLSVELLQFSRLIWSIVS